MASSTTPDTNVAVPAQSSSSYPRATDPNRPDYGPANIVVNDAGEKVLTNGGKGYGHSSQKYGYDHLRCTECVQLARESGLTQDRIRTRIETFKVSGLDTDDPRLRSDLNSIHHYCCTGYTPVRAKRKAPMDANDRLEKHLRREPEEDAAMPDIFGQVVPMKDGSYGYWHEDRAIMLKYKEDGKVSSEIHRAKDVYCVLCSERDPQYHCRALILRGNFVLFDPAQGDGDNVHICLDEADERKQMQQPMGSHRILQEPPGREPSPAKTEQQGVNQLPADVLDAPLNDTGAFLNAMFAHKDATKIKSESPPNSAQPAADSSLLAHSSPIVRPDVASASSAAGSRTTSAALSDDDVVMLDHGEDEDTPTSTAPTTRVNAEPLDVSNARTASGEFTQTPAPSPNTPITSTAASSEPAPDVKPSVAIPSQRPTGVPVAYKDSKVFGKADFLTEGSQTYAVYKDMLDGVDYKFKQLRTSTVSLVGETFEVGIYQCYDCDLVLAERGSIDAVGRVKVANGYFVDSNPGLPERIPHCCKPTPQQR